MLVCLCSHNYSSCDNVLALIRFDVSYGSGTPCCSEICNLMPVITFQRYPTRATSVQTRFSALVLRLIKFQRYATQGYEIVCFHFWLDAIKLKTQTLEITSIKRMWCHYLFRNVRRIFVIWQLLTPRHPLHCTSKNKLIKNRWAKRGVWYKMFHITDVFYWGNPNPKKSPSFTPYTSTF